MKYLLFGLIISISIGTLNAQNHEETITIDFGSKTVDKLELDADKIYQIQVIDLPANKYKVLITLDNVEIEAKKPDGTFFGKGVSDWQSLLSGFTPSISSPTPPLEVILTTSLVENIKEFDSEEFEDSITPSTPVYENFIGDTRSLLTKYRNLVIDLNNYIDDLRNIELDILSPSGFTLDETEITALRSEYSSLNGTYNEIKIDFLKLQDSLISLYKRDVKSPDTYKRVVFENSNAELIINNIKELITALEKPLSTELNQKLFKSLYSEFKAKQADSVFTYTSLPFKTHGDKGTVKISITPTDNNKTGSSYNTTLKYPKFQEFTLNVGLTPYVGFWGFDEYSVDQIVQGVDTTYTLASSKASNTLGFGLALKPTWKLNKWFGLHGNIGVGVPLLNTSVYEGLLGGGLSFDMNYNFTIDFGVLFKHQKVLDGINVGDTRETQFEDYTKDGIAIGYFLGLGFSMPL